MRNSSRNTECSIYGTSMARLCGIGGGVLTRSSAVETRRSANLPFLPDTFPVYNLCTCLLLLFSPHHSQLLHFKMDSSKPSLPRLSTNILLLEQVPNALAPKALSNANVPPVIMPERPAPPSLFKEENREENVAPITRLSEPKPVYLAPKSVPDSPIAKPMKTMYYEDAFTVRGSNHSPKDRVAQDSVVIVELKTNIKVSVQSY